MSLSLNEIKTRSYQFVKEWENENNEKAEAKSFWDAFFNVFGVSRRRVATFEQPATKIDNSKGYIDLLWKGVVLVEHKSKGKNLDTAYAQAKNYFPFFVLRYQQQPSVHRRVFYKKKGSDLFTE